MKQWIKEHVPFYKYYVSAKTFFMHRLSLVSPTLVSKIYYKQKFGRPLNLENPKEFNEKLQWLKLKRYQNDPLVIQCADKVKARDYVEACGCKDILIECIGVYGNPESIPWDELPEKFVLKCNHGAGYNIICPDKKKLDVDKAKKQLNLWLKEDYALPYAEMHYHKIPRRIICEEYIQPQDGLVPDDYKVYCFDGKADYIMLCREREHNGEEEVCKYYFFDKEWNFYPWDKSTSDEKNVCIERPEQIDKMLEYASILSKGFPFVRVDFYVMNDRIYFGEMTFTPCGCLDGDLSPEANKTFSEQILIR